MGTIGEVVRVRAIRVPDRSPRPEPAIATNGRGRLGERGHDERHDATNLGEEPIVAVKYAQLVAVDEHVNFAPAFPRSCSQPYRAIANAVCESEHRHPAPALHCRCGFHAVAKVRDLWRVAPAINGVVLDVELAGMVIEHRRGWRAAHEVVLGVHLPAKCARFLCRRPTVAVASYRAPRSGIGTLPWTPLRPVCARCAKRHGIPVADLAAALGVEVSVDRGPRVAPGDSARVEVRTWGTAFSNAMGSSVLVPSSVAMLSLPRARPHH